MSEKERESNSDRGYSRKMFSPQGMFTCRPSEDTPDVFMDDANSKGSGSILGKDCVGDGNRWVDINGYMRKGVFQRSSAGFVSEELPQSSILEEEIPDVACTYENLMMTRKKFSACPEFKQILNNQYNRIEGYVRMDSSKNSGVELASGEQNVRNEASSEDGFVHLQLNDDESLYQFYQKEIATCEIIDQVLGSRDFLSSWNNPAKRPFIKPSSSIGSSENTPTAAIVETVKDELSAISASQTMSVEKAIKICNKSLKDLLKSGFGSRKRWHLNDRVKHCGIADRLSLKERNQQESLFEIMTSEKSYLLSMQLLVDHFMNDRELKQAIGQNDPIGHHHLFSNATEIVEASREMVTALQNLWQQDCLIDVKEACKTMTSLCRKYSEKYITYCKNQAYQQRKLHELMLKPQIVEIISRLERAERVKGLNLQSFIALPFQRVTRMPLLIKTVQGYSPDNIDGSNELNECFEAFEEVTRKCDEGIWRMTCVETMANINSKLIFKHVPTIQIITPSRTLMKEGTFKSENLHLIVFSDLVLVTKKKSGDKFSVIHYSEKCKTKTETIVENEDGATKSGLARSIKRHWMKVKRLSTKEDSEESSKDSSSPANPPVSKKRFSLELLETGEKFILTCESESEKVRWIDVLTVPTENIPVRKIEANDYEQVKAVKKCTANEPDELDLEEADVVLLLQKTTTGWYKGERLRDGRVGWFQARDTLNIWDEEVRSTNVSVFRGARIFRFSDIEDNNF